MKARALCALAALLCVHCGKERLVGGYDDVENPAIEVSLRDTLGNAYATGEMRVYARYQNPSKDSTPILAQSIAAGTAARIRDTALLAAMGRAADRGIPWPSHDTVEFNLCAIAPGGEAFVGDFLLVKAKDGTFGFMRRSAYGMTHADAKGVLATAPVMAPPVLGQKGSIGDRGRQLGLQSVFIPGSPYAAEIGADGSFGFARMARGKYDVKSVSLDSNVYTAQDSLDTGAEYLPADWSQADLLWIE